MGQFKTTAPSLQTDTVTEQEIAKPREASNSLQKLTLIKGIRKY